MHEASLVAAMCKEIKRLAATEGAQKVTRILVRIGEASGVEIEAFSFAFKALKGLEPILSEAELEIEKTELVFECPACGHRQKGSWEGRCLRCHNPGLRLVSGDELHLISVDLITGEDHV
ncbi:hydrogenase maturation nickel metallochaperone HypA/HybF [Thermosulfuriphilus sp.]